MRNAHENDRTPLNTSETGERKKRTSTTFRGISRGRNGDNRSNNNTTKLPPRAGRPVETYVNRDAELHEHLATAG